MGILAAMLETAVRLATEVPNTLCQGPAADVVTDSASAGGFGAAVAIAVGFLVGSLPTAWLVVRALRGIDVREHGSGNVGATNASRCFEGGASRAVFVGIYLVDFLKGVLPVLGAAWLLGDVAGLGSVVSVMVGVAAVLGHCFTPWLGWRGGKGVATTTGVFAAIEPIALIAALVVFGVVRKATGQVFWGSLAIGFILALVTILRDPSTAFGERAPASIVSLLVAAFLVWTHRSNLRGFFAPNSAEAA